MFALLRNHLPPRQSLSASRKLSERKRCLPVRRWHRELLCHREHLPNISLLIFPITFLYQSRFTILPLPMPFISLWFLENATYLLEGSIHQMASSMHLSRNLLKRKFLSKRIFFSIFFGYSQNSAREFDSLTATRSSRGQLGCALNSIHLLLALLQNTLPQFVAGVSLACLLEASVSKSLRLHAFSSSRVTEDQNYYILILCRAHPDEDSV